jgi:inner membrane protein
MENLAHTLLGLTMAEAGLESVTPLATTTLIISSNLPDLDLVMYLRGDAFSYIKYHRGLTHSFVGLVVLAVALAVVLTLFDRWFRLRRGAFLRPVRPGRIFWLALLGGLGHLALDFTNSYGVRPLIPFNDRWFYGDFVFVVDPWIWLLLGFSVVWFTLKPGSRPTRHRIIIALWLIVGILVSAAVALALRRSTIGQPSLSRVIGIVWFGALAVVILGAMLGWGRRGLGYARWSLLLLAIYYGGMWMAHQSAAERAAHTEPADTIASASWPQPGNPLLWESVCSAAGKVDSRFIDLTEKESEPAAGRSNWQELAAPDPALIEALRQSGPGQTFLNFARMPTSEVIERPDGYSVTLRDSRFGLKLHAKLDRDMNVQSSSMQW